MEVLLSMINRQTVDPTLQLLSPELVIRESTAVIWEIILRDFLGDILRVRD